MMRAMLKVKTSEKTRDNRTGQVDVQKNNRASSSRREDVEDCLLDHVTGRRLSTRAQRRSETRPSPLHCDKEQIASIPSFRRGFGFSGIM
ncbi:hypothetical protein EYF80_019881 [Liparis tanakae]|uniref:Uncharacterized protein n=1 Tax=Liparis tanakae TaxID=230148 RepID=A0A4Z2HXV7_9TELE|nr:hypothetical protein EYF80_019881 [Liparis tanakae]